MIDKSEKRDLYDINKKLTGETIYKGEEIPENRYILVVLIFIQNSKGEFLIQKRSKIKQGKYASTGGHAKTGETSLEAIHSEVKEEIGFDIDCGELKLFNSGRSDEGKAFFDIYYLKKDIDIDKLILQKEEVDFIKWCSIEEVIQLIEKGEFLESHAEEFYILLDKLNKNRL